ncbi:MAG TPA: SDR family NAD(P)-dependent oxidoreductase [Alphaproteobacteria bacterium]|nr:SDR family NAD(P)-dependent oxidoreductase [Alphaproteobacteria bacterium]
MPSPTRNEKLAVVTGATAGVGKYTALGLARLGYAVIVTGRDAARLAAAKTWIEAEAPGARIMTEQADFAVLAEVRAMGERIAANHSALDLLVNNAGLIMLRHKTTGDGFEMTWQVNHLAPFLLTNLLLPALKAGAPSRIVNVASGAARAGRIHFDDVNRTGHLIGTPYPQSKLANVMFTQGLARRLDGSGVTASAVHPGFVASNFGNKGAITNLIWVLLRPLQISAEKGAEQPLFAATAPDAAAISGRYLENKKPAKLRGQANDPEAVERLWRVSTEMVGLPAL